MNLFYKELHRLAEINPKIPYSLDKANPVSFVPMAAISERTCTIVFEEMRKVDDVIKGFTYFEQGDILLAKITPCFENGKVAIADIKTPIGFGTTEFHVIRPYKDALHPKFLFYFFRQEAFRQEGAKKMTGSAGQKRVPKQFIENLKIPLIPIDAQKKIVAFLDKTDMLRQKRRQAIEKLDQLLQSVFIDMFGDPVSNPRKWPIGQLGESIVFMTSGSRGWAKYYSEDGYMFIRIQNIKNGNLILDDVQCVTPPDTVEARRTKVRTGDLLISITADLGRTAVVDAITAEKGAFINQHISLLRLNSRYNPVFVSSFLESPGGKNQFSQLDQVGVKSGLNFNSINSLKVLCPPISLQNEFVRRITKIRERIIQYQASSMKMVALFNSLLRRAFTGA